MYLLHVSCKDLEAPCPWSIPTDETNVMKCKDGTYCDVVTDKSQWSCCNDHGGRAKCPANNPVMCATPSCGTNGSEYCCYTDDECIESFGGLRSCEDSGRLLFDYKYFVQTYFDC